MHHILRRILGAVIILVGLAGLGFAVYGAFWVQDAADQVERDLVTTLDGGLSGLEVVSDTLIVIVQAVDDAGTVLDDAATGSQSAADTIDAMRPAVRELSDVVAYDLPADIRRIQDAMPALEQAGGAIDKTLRTLADFQWSATIPIINYPLEFGLGIEYDPPVPLDESVAELSVALEELPGKLAGVEALLLATDQGLGDTSESMGAIGESLATVQADLDATSAVLADYNDLVAGVTDRVRSVRRHLRARLDGIRLTLTGILIWLALSQLAPLYIGAALLFAKSQTSEPR